MTPEEKQLLLQDLSARLLYGVKCTTKSSWNGIYTIEGYKDNRVFLDCPVYDEGDDEWMIESIVPYLRPMSSMTEEEKQELYSFDDYESISWIDSEEICFKNITIPFDLYTQIIDWLNAHHFDYRDLIPKGLAIEAPEGMYK